MNILYVSQYFPPEMGAPAARVYELSREWVRLGHDVTVLTGFPNHPTGVIPLEYRGYITKRETVDGVDIVRVPIYAAPNKGLFRRGMNYASFAVSTSVVGPFLTSRPDVLVATSPQFLTAVAGLWLARLKRVPFVFEVRDLWPRSIVEVGAIKSGTPVIRVMERIERLLYQRADHIVPVTESFVDEISAHGISREKMTVVTNGVDLERFRPEEKAAARRALGLPANAFYATYIGTHGMAHGLGTILDCAPLLRGRVKFLLVGEGAEKATLKARAERERIENVTFWDQRPRDEVVKIIAASDVCLVLLRDKPLFRTVIPSKIFEFMACGRGIITTVDGESRRIVERAGAGVFSPPEDPRALAAALEELSHDPNQLTVFENAGRAYVERHYSRRALAGRYIDVLAGVSGRSGPTKYAA